MTRDDSTATTDNIPQDPVADVFNHLNRRQLNTGRKDLDLSVLCEEIVRVLAGRRTVVFAAIVANPQARGMSLNRHGDILPSCVMCESDCEEPRWTDHLAVAERHFAPPGDRVADQKAGTDESNASVESLSQVVEGTSEILQQCGWPDKLVAVCASSLIIPIARRDQASLLIVLGCDCPPGKNRQLPDLLERIVDQAGSLVQARWEVQHLNTELRAARAENDALTRLNRLQGKFVAVASHEIKTPLTSITAYSEVLQQNLSHPDFPQAAEFLSVIKSESGRLLRMVNRILDFSRMEFGHRLLNPQPLSLVDLITDSLQTLDPHLHAKQMQLVRRIPVDLPLAEVDGDLIKQVLINLVNNAIKYTPDGGEISINAVEDAATLRIDISDTGPGIPAEELRSIFQQFYRVGGETAAEDGTGLGLTIVKNIVNLHGGFVDVQSRPGEGATFSFHLPKQLWHGESATVLHLDHEQRTVWQRVTGHCLKMLAEMHEARTAVLLLLDPTGQNLVIDSALGLPVNRNSEIKPLTADTLWQTTIRDGSNDHGLYDRGVDRTRLVTPLQVGKQVVGLIQVSQRIDASDFDDDDLRQLDILSAGIAAALDTVLASASDSPDVGRIVDALEALTRIKRNSIPTASPVALRVLGATAQRLGFCSADVRQLQYVAALHDAGMVQVDEDIIHKQGRLNAEEWDEVDRHPEQGAELMSPLLWNSEMDRIIRSHHERIDGSGFPDGVKGDEIPLGARILAVVDAFFSLVNPRPYRAGMDVEQAVGEISANAGTQFDQDVVNTFLDILEEEKIHVVGGALDGDESNTCGSLESR